MRDRQPVLISIEGDDDVDNDEYGIDDDDMDALLSGEMTEDEFYSKYPELMGIPIATILSTVVGGAVKLGKSIAGAVKKKKEAKKATEEKKKAEAELALQQTVAKNKKTMAVIGLSAGGLLLLYLLMR